MFIIMGEQDGDNIEKVYQLTFNKIRNLKQLHKFKTFMERKKKNKKKYIHGLILNAERGRLMVGR